MKPEPIEQYISRLNTSEANKALFRRFGIRYAWWAMLTIVLAVMATLVTGTIINVAIPEIMRVYAVGQEQAQWLSTSYLAAATVGMLTSSWLVRSFGLRAALPGMMILFLSGSLLGGTSPNLELMILGRIMQGLSAGQVMPLSMAIIFQLFPPGREGLAMGLSSMGAVLAPALGPTIGGILVDAFSWRYVFFLGAPFSLLCIPLALLFMPERDGPRPQLPFDWPGLGLLSIAISTLLVALTGGERLGWGSRAVVLPAVASVISGLGFILHEQRSAVPLLNLKLFGIRRFAVFSFTAFMVGGGLYGSMYLIPLFLQLVQGMSAREAGLAMLPAGLVMAAAVPVGGRLVDRFDPRWLISIGVSLIALSFALMHSATASTVLSVFVAWMILGRLGIAFAFPAISLGAVKSVPLEELSQASGALNFIRQLGGAFGVNLLSLVLLRRTRLHSEQDSSDGMETMLSTAKELVASLPLDASAHAFQDCFLIAACVFLLALIPTWMLGKQGTRG